jgi:hypothetical protein
MNLHDASMLDRSTMRLLRVLAIAAAALLACTCTAAAAPAWRIDTLANTTAAPGNSFQYVIQITNVGDEPAPPAPAGDAGNCTPGSPPPSDPAQCYTVTASFPAGMTPVSATQILPGGLACAIDAGTRTATCSVPGDQADQAVQPTSGITTRTTTITVDVAPDAAGTLTPRFSVAGGGATNAPTTVRPTIVTPIPPGFGVAAFDAQTSADPSGAPLTQAAGHPYELSTSIDFNTIENPNPALGMAWPVEATRDVYVDLPPGLIGNPTAADTCTVAELTNGADFQPRPLCVPSAQIGTVMVRLNAFGSNFVFGPLPLFNMVPPPGVPARLGFDVLGTLVMMDAKLRTGSDYGVTVAVKNISEGIDVAGTTATIWGVPSDRSHDHDRACPGRVPPQNGGGSCESDAPPNAFLRLPTACTEPGAGLETSVRIDSWVHPGVFQSRSFLSHDLPGYPYAPADWGPPRGIEGCDAVPFDPTFSAAPDAAATAGEPAGFSFDVGLPQSDAAPVGESDLRRAVVTLPEGVRVNPSSADGLQACGSAQIALDSDTEPTCPDAAKIGTVRIVTPVLDSPLDGGVYLATPFANPFGSLVALYVVARGPGILLKIPGQASMDPSTGQITTSFDNTPQAPFSQMHLTLKGGPRAALTLPSTCGTYTTHAQMTSWSGATRDLESSFALDRNAGGSCAGTFAPRFRAGTASPVAGASTSFRLQIQRDDTDAQFADLTVAMPRGLTGKIASADLCGDAQANADQCPASSKIGDVTVGAGAGSNPFFIQSGKAYLTGPYKGAPFGVAIVVPAVAGPFDLGKVTVRSALFVDKQDATVRIVSDPFPTILQGIPLDVRDVRVDVNKPGFFLNPTSCAEKTITGTLTSTEGMRADVSDRFQAADCASLGFKPRMTMRVGGRGHTRPGRTSSFTTRLTMPQRNQANLRFVRVTLPPTINARLNTIQDACTRQEFESDIGKCAHAKAGSATAVTPLLRDPLRGTVYFVKNGHAIPDLFVALRGQVDFDLVGTITIVNNKLLRTTFATAPDVPIRSFALRLLGGASTASIGATRNLCSRSSRAQKAQVDYIGQNGKVRQVDQTLKVGGCHGSSHRKHRRR